MIFVDEIHATLETSNGSSFVVNYKMSALEKKFCEILTLQVASYLNKMLDGLINFQVDNYFTKNALGEENLEKTDSIHTDGTRTITYTVPSKNIKEVSEMIDKYECIMTTFSFNDYKDVLHYAAGYGNERDIMVHFENLLLQTFYNGDTIEDLFDLEYKEWDHIMDAYIHEFAHSIEQGMSVYPLHSALSAYSSQGVWGLEPLKLYLLNQAIVDGKKVGIPYTYWTDEVYTVKYIAEKNDYEGEMGWIEGSVLPSGKPQRVAKGYDAFSVTVKTFPGYEFIGWSDGVTTATRTDTNIQSDLTIIAYFKPINNR